MDLGKRRITKGADNMSSQKTYYYNGKLIAFIGPILLYVLLILGVAIDCYLGTHILMPADSVFRFIFATLSSAIGYFIAILFKYTDPKYKKQKYTKGFEKKTIIALGIIALIACLMFIFFKGSRAIVIYFTVVTLIAEIIMRFVTNKIKYEDDIEEN